MIKNSGAQTGDMLILTKPLGTGILTTAVKAELISYETADLLIKSMSALNKTARDIMIKYDVHACTDVTGFGLLGHCAEMASASDVTFELNVRNIAYMEDAIDFAKMGLIPAGAYKNRGYSIKMVDTGSVEEHYLDLLYDPQTSGGLLISVSPDNLQEMLADFARANMDTTVSVIGRVAPKSDKWIRLF